MQKLLTSNIVPVTHPLYELTEKHKRCYLLGLGEALSVLSGSDTSRRDKAKLCHDLLCLKVLNRPLSDGLRQTDDLSNIRKALSICREGFRLFSMGSFFWWDVYRISRICDLPVFEAKNDKLLHKVTGWFGKGKRHAAKSLYYESANVKGLPEDLVSQAYDEFEFHKVPLKRVLIVGTMSAGKSTVINALIGHKVAKTKATVCTTGISHIYNNPSIPGVLGRSNMGYTLMPGDHKFIFDISEISLPINGTLEKDHIVFIDTPGVDYAGDETHRRMTFDAIEKGDYDLLICVNNAPYIERTGEHELINHVLKKNDKKLLFVFNQLDRFDPADDSIVKSIEQFTSYVCKEREDVQVVPLSARAAYLFKKEKTGVLSKVEEIDLKQMKSLFGSDFYDLGMHATGTYSNAKDCFARCGLTNLETTISNS